MLGAELHEKYAGKARDILTSCTESGLLVLVAGANVMRLAPPLNIGEADIEEGLEIMEQAIETMIGSINTD